MCNCIKDVSEKIKERFDEYVSNVPKAVVAEPAEMTNVCLVFNRKQPKQLFAPVEGKYKVGKQSRKYSENLVFTYCPFCGNKVD